MKAASITTSCMKFLFPFSEDPIFHGSHTFLKPVGLGGTTSLATLHHFISNSSITTDIFQYNFNSSAGQFYCSYVFRAAHVHTTPAIKHIPHTGNKSSVSPPITIITRYKIDYNRMQTLKTSYI